MKQIYVTNNNNDLEQAVSTIENPSGLILITNESNFEKHVKQLESIFPNVPSIGGIATGYAENSVIENGVTVIALYEAKISANVLEELSTMPMKYISRIEDSINEIQPSKNNTVCFDFCSGSDGKLVTTINIILKEKNIPLIGGTVDCNKVSMNGKIYNNSCAFLMIKNLTGKICTYRENIYIPMGERVLVNKTQPAKMILDEVDSIPVVEYYTKKLNVKKEDIVTQGFKNPLGYVYDNQTYIFSIKDVVGSSLQCYKQVNDLDVLTLMYLGDYKSIVENTVAQIKQDLPNLKGVISINCILRYLLFKQENYIKNYLSQMNILGSHAGMVGLGEHYHNQHINQSMVCIAFD